MTNHYFACLWDGKDLPKYSGGKYSPVWVERLNRGIERHDPDGKLTMLVDDCYAPMMRDLGVGYRMFSGDDCGGWSKMLEVYRPWHSPAKGERHVAIGLDSVFVGDPTWLFCWSIHPVGLPLDPYWAPNPCNAAVSYSAEGAGIIWDFYQKEKARNGMKDHRVANKPSEMALLRALFAQHDWGTLEPSPQKLLSYKVHVQGRKVRNRRQQKRLHQEKKDWTKASIVYFHGSPKPDDLPAGDPIREEWERVD